MIEKRFARNQAVSNTGVLLFQLTQVCINYLEFDLYGTSWKHGLDTAFRGDHKERAEEVALVAMELLQEVGMTKEDIMRAWDAAQKNLEELEQIVRRDDA
jgi:hypothetical protein